MFLLQECVPGSVAGYSNWLRAGLSGDRMPVGSRFPTPVQTGPGTHPASCIMGTGSFPGVKSGRGVMLTPHPFLLPLGVELYLYSPMGRTASTEPQCLYKGVRARARARTHTHTHTHTHTQGSIIKYRSI